MQRYGYILLVLFLLAGCVSGDAAPRAGSSPSVNASQETSAPPTELSAVPLENLGPAPELTNDVWLNAEKPLRLAELRGNVVLLEMWTYG